MELYIHSPYVFMVYWLVKYRDITFYIRRRRSLPLPYQTTWKYASTALQDTLKEGLRMGIASVISLGML
jgi:hypothetical protein